MAISKNNTKKWAIAHTQKSCRPTLEAREIDAGAERRWENRIKF